MSGPHSDEPVPLAKQMVDLYEIKLLAHLNCSTCPGQDVNPLRRCGVPPAGLRMRGAAVSAVSTAIGIVSKHGLVHRLDGQGQPVMVFKLVPCANCFPARRGES